MKITIEEMVNKKSFSQKFNDIFIIEIPTIIDKNFSEKTLIRKLSYKDWRYNGKNFYTGKDEFKINSEWGNFHYNDVFFSEEEALVSIKNNNMFLICLNEIKKQYTNDCFEAEEKVKFCKGKIEICNNLISNFK